MQNNNIIDEILSLPRSFRNFDSISIEELLKKTGYFELYEEISVQDIQSKLSVSSEYIQEWLTYSENKRTDSGYYIKNRDADCIVGHINSNGEQTEKRYINIIEAYASYIKNEIEEIRRLAVTK